MHAQALECGDLTLRQMVEREIQSMTDEGRTTARWFAELDQQLRDQGLLSNATAEERAMALDESRAERDARYDEWRR
jgi:hypothetical protein